MKTLKKSKESKSNATQSPSAATAKHFNLVRWFGLVSFISIVLASTASAVLLSRFLTDRLLVREAQIMTEIVNSIVKVERADKIVGSSKETEWLHGDVQEFFYHLAGLPEVLRANVYLPNHFIVWSTDFALIDRKFGDNKELDEAFHTGIPKIKMGIVGELEKAEHVFFKKTGQRFVESYLPIWGEGKDLNRVVAIAEVYRTPKFLFEAIEQGITAVWLSAGAAGGAIFLALFWIIRRAAIIMQRQQHQIIQSEMLAAVGEMASTVAHSLRNPLASIRSSAELALESVTKKSVMGLLQNIVTDSDRLENWVRQYLAQMIPENSAEGVTEITTAIEQSVQAFSTELARRDIRVSADSAPDLPAVGLSTFLVTQILNGLIANALEAVPDGGEIDIEAQAAQESRKVSIKISDTGPGLPEEQLADVFKPFTTSKSAGLGLGLPLAKRIVERHGGELTLGNREQGGAVATILLPAVV